MGVYAHFSRLKLGLLKDLDLQLFFESGIRGGIKGVRELRHFTANNDLDSFDPRQKTFSAFHDVTSLYAGIMQKLMPLDSYRWNTEITIEQISENSSVVYFVEVDLKYPQYLPNLHNGLPLAPEKLIIRSSRLSPFAKSFGIKANKTRKLD